MAFGQLVERVITAVESRQIFGTGDDSAHYIYRFGRALSSVFPFVSSRNLFQFIVELIRICKYVILTSPTFL